MSDPVAQPEFLTADEVAHRLRCTRQQVYVLNETAGLKLVKIGGRTLARATTLEQWIDDHEGNLKELNARAKAKKST